MAHNPLFLTIPVALFLILTFVEIGLAFGEGDLALHQMIFPVQRGAHTGMALLIHPGFKLVEFATIE